MASIRSYNSDDPTPKKLTPKQLAEANAFAQAFALRKGVERSLAQNMQVGERGAPFIDAATGKVLLPNSITNYQRNLPRTAPYYVKELMWDAKSNNPYYIDEKTGDVVDVHPDLFYSTRFRKPKTSITDYAKK